MPGRSTRMTNSHTACRTMLKRTATQSIRNVLLSRSLQCQRTSIYRLELYLNHKTAPTVLRIPWSTRPFSSSSRLYTEQKQSDSEPEPTNKPSIRENIYTLPNLLTLSRICACPVLGWSILDGNYHLATGLLVYAGLTDLADGYLARRFKMSSVLGTILDPAADKILMTTLVVTLTMQDLIPVPLAVIILGRDVLLSLSALYFRYATLSPPKTFSRYWDFSLPSAEVRPTTISKVNTALQLLLMGTTTISPIFELGFPLPALQILVATTTIWSGFSYIFSKDAIRVVSQPKDNKHGHS